MHDIYAKFKENPSINWNLLRGGEKSERSVMISYYIVLKLLNFKIDLRVYKHPVYIDFSVDRIHQITNYRVLTNLQWDRAAYSCIQPWVQHYFLYSKITVLEQDSRSMIQFRIPAFLFVIGKHSDINVHS
jgi:hypothetical protein